MRNLIAPQCLCCVLNMTDVYFNVVCYLAHAPYKFSFSWSSESKNEP